MALFQGSTDVDSLSRTGSQCVRFHCKIHARSLQVWMFGFWKVGWAMVFILNFCCFFPQGVAGRDVSLGPSSESHQFWPGLAHPSTVPRGPRPALGGLPLRPGRHWAQFLSA